MRDTGYALNRELGSRSSVQSSSSGSQSGLASKVELFNELKQLLQSKGLEDSLSVVKKALLAQQAQVIQIRHTFE